MQGVWSPNKPAIKQIHKVCILKTERGKTRMKTDIQTLIILLIIIMSITPSKEHRLKAAWQRERGRGTFPLFYTLQQWQQRKLLPSVVGLGFQCGWPQCCLLAPPWVLLHCCCALHRDWKPEQRQERVRRSPLPGSCCCQCCPPGCRWLRVCRGACVSVCMRAVAAAGPAVKSWVAHVCRLPDAEACSVLGSQSQSLSLLTHTLTHRVTHAPAGLVHTTRTLCLQHASLAWERKRGRESKACKEGGRMGMGRRVGVTEDYRWKREETQKKISSNESYLLMH